MRVSIETTANPMHMVDQPTLADLHGRSYIIVYVCREIGFIL